MLTILFGFFLTGIYGDFTEGIIVGYGGAAIGEAMQAPKQMLGYCMAGDTLRQFPPAPEICLAGEYFMEQVDPPSLMWSLFSLCILILSFGRCIYVCLFGSHEEREELAGVCVGACLYSLMNDDD